jgi:hypothetical protein
MYEKVSPGISVPELNTPVSELTVCGIWPVLVQQTVVPAAIVSASGL